MAEVATLPIAARVTAYLDVVNRALTANRDRVPYRQILALSEKLFDDRKIAIAVYKDDRGAPHHWFTVQYDDGRFELEQQGKGESDMCWKVREAHIDEVIEHPDDYIAHPYRLDLDWLKKTLRIGG